MRAGPSDHSATFFSVMSEAEEAVAILAEIHRLACTSLRGALPPLRRSLRCADCRGSACLSLSVTPGHLGTYGKPRFTPRAWAKFQVLGTYETTVMQPDHFRTRDAPDGRLGCGRLSPILATNSTFWSVCPSSVGIGPAQAPRQGGSRYWPEWSRPGLGRTISALHYVPPLIGARQRRGRRWDLRGPTSPSAQVGSTIARGLPFQDGAPASNQTVRKTRLGPSRRRNEHSIAAGHSVAPRHKRSGYLFVTRKSRCPPQVAILPGAP